MWDDVSTGQKVYIFQIREEEDGEVCVSLLHLCFSPKSQSLPGKKQNSNNHKKTMPGSCANPGGESQVFRREIS